MESTLMTALSEMEEADFIELRHTMEIAQNLRDIMKVHGKDAKFIANELEVELHTAMWMINASHEFDMRTIAKIECLSDKLYAEARRKKSEMSMLAKFNTDKTSQAEKDLIEFAVNNLFNQMNNDLKKSDLGDIEKSQYESIKIQCKNFLDK